ncbi:hypothetical protein KA005_31990 [bacterium]|nr:hypothetical protein [bacterium]
MSISRARRSGRGQKAKRYRARHSTNSGCMVVIAVFILPLVAGIIAL